MEKIDWDKQPLGKYSDSAIARWLKVDHTLVAYHRKKRGIASCKRGGAFGGSRSFARFERENP